jgi:hypothetical protein
MKTAEDLNDRPTPPPSDREVVKEFIANGDLIAESMKTIAEDKNFYIMQGHVEARKLLAEELETARLDRVAYVKYATDRFTQSMTEAGEKVAEALNSWYRRKSEEYEARDRK